MMSMSIVQSGRARVVGVVVLGVAVLAGCGGGTVFSEDGLTDSFAEQIATVELVREFERRDRELTFVREDAGGLDVGWRVDIEFTAIEPYDDAATPYRGIVRSSWYADDRLVTHTDTTSRLPAWILDTGVSQDCWAWWIEEAQQWDW